MEIIVPAAGLSTRFPEMKPKYLLYDYKGDLMIRNAIRPYMDDYTIHIGILKEHDEKYNASELLKYELGEDVIIHILDEPTTGLHFADIQLLLDVIHKLRDAGNTIVIIEHNLDVIKSSDWVIDMGPEGGFRGGSVVAEGTPEQVAAITSSYTGQLLAEILETNRTKTPAKKK